MKHTLTLASAAFALAVAGTSPILAADEGAANAPDPGPGYELVSDLVALPAFLPGLGALYVKPETLPAGPFLAYDRDNKLVSTVYMIPLDDLDAHKAFEALHAPGEKVVATDFVYNAGHPGVDEPHYHVILWHVDAASARLD